MKKKISLIVTIFISICVNSVFAAEITNYQNYELDKLIHEIEKPGAPIITEDYIIFTADSNNRHVGIAFDFENYKIIHPFEILTRTDEDGNVTREHMFYCYKREHKLSSLTYRLVIDGLWTTDPYNPNKIYDDSVNLYFSKVEDPDSIKIYTEATKDDTVHFIYQGKSGQEIRLAGNFTNWDPWIYELTETKPGFYELNLPLPQGKYLYTYYVGLSPVLDSTNSQKMYSNDGRVVNVIVVN